MKNLRNRIAVLLIASFIIAAAGCGQKTALKASDKSSTRGDTAAAETVAAYNDANYGEAVAMDYAADACYEEYAYEPESYASSDSFGTSTYENTAANGANTEDTYSPLANQMLIRNIYMNIETSEFSSISDSIKTTVTTLGGYIENSCVNGTGNDGDLRYATYVIRIPSEKMDAMLDVVSDNCIVVYESEDTQDVTLEYSDIESHIEALRIEQTTLLGLLEETSDIDYIITLEQRISEISYEIESYESSARVLSNLATFSTLTLNIEEVLVEVEPEKPVVPEPTKVPTMGEEIKENFDDSWNDVKKDLRRMTVEFLGNSPYLIATIVTFLIVLLPVAIVVIVVIAVVKKRKKKAAKLAAEKAEENAKTETTENKAEEITDEANAET